MFWRRSLVQKSLLRKNFIIQSFFEQLNQVIIQCDYDMWEEGGKDRGVVGLRRIMRGMRRRRKRRRMRRRNGMIRNI